MELRPSSTLARPITSPTHATLATAIGHLAHLHGRQVAHILNLVLGGCVRVRSQAGHQGLAGGVSIVPCYVSGCHLVVVIFKGELRLHGQLCTVGVECLARGRVSRETSRGGPSNY